MGYMLAMGQCCVCRLVFTFNPERVPSCVVNGTREPICLPCVKRANPLRVAKGLPAITILPGAYDAEEVA